MNEQPENPYPTRNPCLTPELIEALCHFFECHPPKEFSKGLLEMTLELMEYRHGGARPYSLNLLPGLPVLYDVLRLAAEGALRLKGREGIECGYTKGISADGWAGDSRRLSAWWVQV
jgi:hypothetical protein